MYDTENTFGFCVPLCLTHLDTDLRHTFVFICHYTDIPCLFFNTCTYYLQSVRGLPFMLPCSEPSMFNIQYTYNKLCWHRMALFCVNCLDAAHGCSNCSRFIRTSSHFFYLKSLLCNVYSSAVQSLVPKWLIMVQKKINSQISKLLCPWRTLPYYH